VRNLGVLRLRLCSAVSCPTDAVYRMETSRSDGPTRWSYHDRLGHTVLSVQQGFEAGVSGRDLVATCSYRDVRGQPERSSVPFFLPGVAVAGAPSFAAQPAPCAQPQSWELTDYDLLGRPERVLAPDQSALVFSYAGLRTEQTQVMPTPSGPQYFSRWETRNVLGQVVSELQSQDGQGTAMGMEVQHTYDAQGQLRTTRRDAGRGEIVTEQICDALGRMIERRDPDRGREQFVYNAAGELIRRIDGQNLETRLFYDAQGRLWKRDSGSLVAAPPLPGTQIFASGFEAGGIGISGRQIERWVYDTAPNGIGQLHFDERTLVLEADLIHMGGARLQPRAGALPALLSGTPPARVASHGMTGCLSPLRDHARPSPFGGFPRAPCWPIIAGWRFPSRPLSRSSRCARPDGWPRRCSTSSPRMCGPASAPRSWTASATSTS
jgi:YD repeat-containing protein